MNVPQALRAQRTVIGAALSTLAVLLTLLVLAAPSQGHNYSTCYHGHINANGDAAGYGPWGYHTHYLYHFWSGSLHYNVYEHWFWDGSRHTAQEAWWTGSSWTTSQYVLCGGGLEV